mmetsp:Transcript_2144/g.4356  ORF Transcript_2144/g.4356 Transcript_2144/m.4356 type:complete len:202 (+) Transcript_2144:1359-1964(+)
MSSGDSPLRIRTMLMVSLHTISMIGCDTRFANRWRASHPESKAFCTLRTTSAVVVSTEAEAAWEWWWERWWCISRAALRCQSCRHEVDPAWVLPSAPRRYASTASSRRPSASSALPRIEYPQMRTSWLSDSRAMSASPSANILENFFKSKKASARERNRLGLLGHSRNCLVSDAAFCSDVGVKTGLSCIGSPLPASVARDR